MKKVQDLMERRLAALSAREIVGWAVAEYGRKLAFASSFGAEDMVLLDILLAADAQARVFMLDTGRLPQETYDTFDAAVRFFGRPFEVYFPRAEEVQGLAARQGVNGFRRSIDDRRECCRVRKVEPLGRALEGAAAWLTGQRREQGLTRARLATVETDEAHGGILKVNPLADWTWEQVMDHVRARRLPYNPLHDRGYPSIGCAPCTRAVQPGEDPRAGRWWWESPEHKECGLHLFSAAGGKDCR